MNMRYFKLKYIFAGLLVIVLAVGLILFFVGNLQADSVEYNNISFNKDGFIDIQAELDKAAEDENYTFELNENKVVGENEQYCLLINEDTTVLTLLLKGENWSKENPTDGTVLYTTSDMNGDHSTEKSNITLKYYDSSNKLNSYNSFDNSVAYKDKINDKILKYYQLRYLEEENAVDILYKIGNMLNINSQFPTYFDRTAFEDMFIGNTYFIHTSLTTIGSTDERVEVVEEDGTITEGVEVKLLGSGVTFSSEVAEYLTENGLATVTPASYMFNGVNVENAYYNFTMNKDENGQYLLKAGVNYNCEGSPIKINPFLINSMINQLTQQGTGYYELISGDGEDVKYVQDFLVHIEGSSPTFKLNDEINSGQLTTLSKYFYGGGEFTTTRKVNKKTITIPVYYDYNGDGEITYNEKYIYGGYQATDEDGNYLYDENMIPVQSVMTKEDAEIQNNQFGLTDEAKTTNFTVCVRVSLTDTGLESRIISESLEENQGSLSSIALFPNLTVNKDKTSKGQIIIPDGSGAVISFNSVKDSQTPQMYVEKRVYGSDVTIPLMEESIFSQDIMFGMYGFLEQSEGKGMVVIADQGAGQLSIEANFLRSNQMNTYNEVRFHTYLRESENVQITSTTAYTKITKDLYPEDIIFKYELLLGDNLTYVDVANVYRNYLIEKYDLEEKDNTTTNNLSINFLGAFTKKQIALGFVYDAELSLTTFDQAGMIVDELRENGIKNMNVSYSYWTDDETQPEITSDVSVSSALGGKKALISLASHLKELGVGFYPEYNAVTGNGYDMAFGNMKYSSKSVSGSYSEIPSFVLSTGQANAEVGIQNVISPRFYRALVDKFIKNADKYEISGLYLANLGNERTADYAKKVQIYSGLSAKYQSNTLKSASENLDGVLLSAPFDYALEYATYALNIPTSTTLYPIIDYSIPLYQLVVSGLVDYSGEYVNYGNDNNVTHNLLKAIETGSNLAFMLSYEDTSILLDTNSTGFYNCYYSNWSNNIIYMNKVLNEEAGIYEGSLVSHEYITDNLVKVEYSNGLTILINYDKVNYQDDATGFTVASNWFTVIEKGA